MPFFPGLVTEANFAYDFQRHYVLQPRKRNPCMESWRHNACEVSCRLFVRNFLPPCPSRNILSNSQSMPEVGTFLHSKAVDKPDVSSFSCWIVSIVVVLRCHLYCQFLASHAVVWFQNLRVWRWASCDAAGGFVSLLLWDIWLFWRYASYEFVCLLIQLRWMQPDWPCMRRKESGFRRSLDDCRRKWELLKGQRFVFNVCRYEMCRQQYVAFTVWQEGPAASD